MVTFNIATKSLLYCTLDLDLQVAIQCISLLLLIFFMLFSVGMRPTQQSLLTSMTMVMLVKSGKYVSYFMQILPSVCNSLLCQEYY